jgi:hypothetical protein
MELAITQEARAIGPLDVILEATILPKILRYLVPPCPCHLSDPIRHHIKCLRLLCREANPIVKHAFHLLKPFGTFTDARYWGCRRDMVEAKRCMTVAGRYDRYDRIFHPCCQTGDGALTRRVLVTGSYYDAIGRTGESPLIERLDPNEIIQLLECIVRNTPNADQYKFVPEHILPDDDRKIIPPAWGKTMWTAERSAVFLTALADGRLPTKPTRTLNYATARHMLKILSRLSEPSRSVSVTAYLRWYERVGRNMSPGILAAVADMNVELPSGLKGRRRAPY